jgi:hypothetical protein
VNPELIGQLIDGKAVKVAGYQPLRLGRAQPSMNLFSGTGANLWRPFWDHFYKVSKTFSLFTGVRVTSDELHKNILVRWHF